MNEAILLAGLAFIASLTGGLIGGWLAMPTIAIRKIEHRVTRMADLIDRALGGSVDAWRCPACQKVNTGAPGTCLYCEAHVNA